MKLARTAVPSVLGILRYFLSGVGINGPTNQLTTLTNQRPERGSRDVISRPLSVELYCTVTQHRYNVARGGMRYILFYPRETTQ